MTTTGTIENQEVFSKAHDVAYDEIKAMIQKQVITDYKVLPLSVLRKKIHQCTAETKSPIQELPFKKN